MRNTVGDTIDTLWTGHWSDKDNSLFCVIHDMTIRNKTERLKEEVMAMVNHDLRSPLTTVQVSLELLKESEKGKLSEKSEALIENMTVSCNQILRLTKDLLDLDRLESGHLELEIEDCNIGAIAVQAIDLTSGLAHRKKIKISTDVQTLIVQADGHRLEQVMTNILTNALKFSPAGSSIHIAVRPTNDCAMAKVSISDQGPGIPSNMLDKVFDRYQQVKEGSGSKNGGSGLGLAICKALVEQHGGKIWVESNAQSGPTRGATFIFTVPLTNR
jgi:signal transduction histidine kinase